MKKTKPDWITLEQWKAVPDEQWWMDEKKKKQYLAQSKPHTPEEALTQFSRLRSEKIWSK